MEAHLSLSYGQLAKSGLAFWHIFELAFGLNVCYYAQYG